MTKLSSVSQMKKYISDKKIGNILLHEKLIKDYEGMIEKYYLIFGLKAKELYLTHRFESKGIDFYADDFHEEHEYDFNNVDEIIIYLENKLGIKLSEMNKYTVIRDVPSPMFATKEETAQYYKD